MPVFKNPEQCSSRPGQKDRGKCQSSGRFLFSTSQILPHNSGFFSVGVRIRMAFLLMCCECLLLRFIDKKMSGIRRILRNDRMEIGQGKPYQDDTADKHYHLS